MIEEIWHFLKYFILLTDYVSKEDYSVKTVQQNLLMVVLKWCWKIIKMVLKDFSELATLDFDSLSNNTRLRISIVQIIIQGMFKKNFL